MIELPEAINLAGQINEVIAGRTVAGVETGRTPHKFAWFYGDRSNYSDLLEGRSVEKARAFGGFVEIVLGDRNILFGEGVNVRFHGQGEKHPMKHQLLVEFADGSALSATVQMYGGMGAFIDGGLDNPYYRIAKERPSPFSAAFDLEHLQGIASAPGASKLSLKALLATEQRVPGLGNGVLQDILFNAGMHPKMKISSLGVSDIELLLRSIKNTLHIMVEQGGRDTEADLFGRLGRYVTVMSKNMVDKPCPSCGSSIKKESYMGGSIHFCDRCQRL